MGGETSIFDGLKLYDWYDWIYWTFDTGKGFTWIFSLGGDLGVALGSVNIVDLCIFLSISIDLFILSSSSSIFYRNEYSFENNFVENSLVNSLFLLSLSEVDLIKWGGGREGYLFSINGF